MSYSIPVLELMVQETRRIDIARQKATCGSDAAKIAQGLIGRAPVEHLIAIMLDVNANVTGIATLAQGSMSRAVVDLASVFRHILTSHCAAFILAHNHPSGDPTPSKEDLEITMQIATAGELLGVRMLDHVIVTRTNDFVCLAT